jgi:AmmeMemoRadiSam system protein A
MAHFPSTRYDVSPMMSSSAHPLIRLASEAIAAFLAEDRIIEPPSELYKECPDALKPAGAFVCLKRDWELRGCVGTTEPLEETLAGEVVRNAVAAATRDPRFAPVCREELPDLSVSVDVLEPSEPVSDRAALDPKRFGIIVRAGEKQSVLLPDLEGIESVAEQLAAARKKAGIGPDEPIELRRFAVTRYR